MERAMGDSFEEFMKIQRELERVRDGLGLGELHQQLARLHDPLGLGSLRHELFAVPDIAGVGAMQLAAMYEVAPLQRELDKVRGVYGIAAMQNELNLGTRVAGLGRLDEIFERTASHSFAERYRHHETFEYGRAFDFAASIGTLGRATRGLGFNALEASIDEATNPSLSKWFESTSLLDEILARTAPSAHIAFMRDLERNATPWLTAHDALWPQESMVLRMLRDDHAFGVASWLPEPAPNDEPRFFELGAFTSQASEGDPIRIDHEVCCALCGAQIFAPSSEAHWIGPERLRMRTNVVPICVPCSERDEREPGYLRESLLALVDAPPPAERLRFEVLDGDELDPAPRGRLTIVRDDGDAPTDEENH
jgi:hypothetical protein